jgi:hypothetical protein
MRILVKGWSGGVEVADCLDLGIKGGWVLIAVIVEPVTAQVGLHRRLIQHTPHVTG